MKKILNDYFSNPIERGIFFYLKNKDTQMFVESDNLNMDYHFNISGDKKASPLLRHLAKTLLIEEDLHNKLADVIWSRYGRNWIKLYETLNLDYNPIENYSMIETIESDREINKLNNAENEIIYGKTTTTDNTSTIDNTESINYGKETNNNKTLAGSKDEDNTINKEINSNLEITESLGTDKTITGTGTVDEETYGFNSTTGVPKSKQNTSTSGNENITSTNERLETNITSDNETQTLQSITSENETTTNTESGLDVITNNTGELGNTINIESGIDKTTNDLTIKDNEDFNQTLKRSGNIGVTTSQQMIESERQLQQWDFYKHIYKDIDTIITINSF